MASPRAASLGDNALAPVTQVSAATTVTLGQRAATLDPQTYPMPLRVEPSPPVWEHRSSDAISSLMARNYVYQSVGSRFQGLGAALLERFASEKGDFSQSVIRVPGGAAPGADVSALATVMQSQMHAQADDQVTLDIKTASGANVHLSLGSQDGGLAVQVEVSGGELSDAERAALEKLSGAFQEAIDGLGAKPPRLDLGGLTQFDTSVLSSVDFHASLKLDGKNTQAVDFHADSKARTVAVTGPSGTVKVDVDLSNPAILGNARQQAQAVDRYLQQFDAANSRGRGDASLMAMFKDAFTELNSNYGVTAPLAGRAAPGVMALNDVDHSMLSGLADFSASVVQAAQSSNPMHPEELDTFSYQASQDTSVIGNDPRNRSVKQQQQSHLDASYHQALSPELSLFLTNAKESQFYYYNQIKDDARSSTDFAYSDGALVRASLSQSASQSTRVQKYMMGRLEGDTTTPSEGARSWDFRELLRAVEKASLSKDPQDLRRREQALATIEGLSGLQTNPATLRRQGSSTAA